MENGGYCQHLGAIPAKVLACPNRIPFSRIFSIVFIWMVSGAQRSDDNFPQFHVLGPQMKNMGFQANGNAYAISLSLDLDVLAIH